MSQGFEQSTQRIDKRANFTAMKILLLFVITLLGYALLDRWPRPLVDLCRGVFVGAVVSGLGWRAGEWLEYIMQGLCSGGLCVVLFLPDLNHQFNNS